MNQEFFSLSYVLTRSWKFINQMQYNKLYDYPLIILFSISALYKRESRLAKFKYYHRFFLLKISISIVCFIWKKEEKHKDFYYAYKK